MLDIMYYHGNDATKELAIAMGKKKGDSVSSSSPTPTSPVSQDWHCQSSSVSSNNSSVHSPTGDDTTYTFRPYLFYVVWLGW